MPFVEQAKPEDGRTLYGKIDTFIWCAILEMTLNNRQHDNPEIIAILLKDKRVNPLYRLNEALEKAYEAGHQGVIIELLKDERVQKNIDIKEVLSKCREHELDEVETHILNYQETKQNKIVN